MFQLDTKAKMACTAAWTFFNVSQYILGVQPTLDGLKIDPCIPHTLPGVTVNGAPIPGNVLPIAAPGETVEVTVVMG